MADEQVVFGNTVEGLFKRGLGGRMTPTLRDRLKQGGLDLDRIQPAYPREDYYRWVNLAAETLFPDLPRERALEELGKQFIYGYQETMLGKAVLSFGRLLGPRKMLARMGHNFRSSNNYLETRFTELSPSSCELWLSETSGAPSYFRGVLLAAVESMGGQSPEVEQLGYDGRTCTFRIRWSERAAA